MTKNQILEWLETEFFPISLATPQSTILQIIDNSIRYWNTHSSLPIVEMYDVAGTDVVLQLSPAYKGVHTVYPSQQPDWILQNYPLWSLLGITIIDNLTSDLIMLSEAYRNYKYYIGTDFHFHYEKSDNPAVGGKLYLSSMPSGATAAAVVGTKRIINGDISVATAGTSGTFEFPPQAFSFSLTDGTQTFTDDAGDGVLVSSQSGYSGTLDYTTGAWTVTGWSAAIVGTDTVATATYTYEEDIKSEHILNWLLYYVKALVQIAEGNTLRKAGSIGIKNDGDQLMSEGREAKKDLEKKLEIEGRWVAFVRKF